MGTVAGGSEVSWNLVGWKGEALMRAGSEAWWWRRAEESYIHRSRYINPKNKGREESTAGEEQGWKKVPEVLGNQLEV